MNCPRIKSAPSTGADLPTVTKTLALRFTRCLVQILRTPPMWASVTGAGDDSSHCCAGMDVELVVDPGEMALDCLFAEKQRSRDVFIGSAARDHCRDLTLARRQCIQTGRSAGPAAARHSLPQSAQSACGGIGFAQRAARAEVRIGRAQLDDRRLAIARRRPRHTANRLR